MMYNSKKKSCHQTNIHADDFPLTGMWGVKLSQDRPQIAGLFQKIFNMEHKDYYGYDQTFLKDFIWPIAQTNMVRIFIGQVQCVIYILKTQTF